MAERPGFIEKKIITLTRGEATLQRRKKVDERKARNANESRKLDGE